jgi:RIO kinase 2
MDDDGNVMALKLHRLGRTSFRAVKSKRDYMRRGSHYSWLYLSRLAALKEFAFMKALGEAGVPVPKAIECNRHAVLMSMIDAHPMVQVQQLANPRKVYEECMRVLVRLAQLGLVHCDYNEFNLLISENEELTLIDFPQMVSISHANAQELFERDVEGVVKFFERKLGYLPEGDPALELVRPRFEDSLPRGNDADGSSSGEKGIDEQLRASGFKKEHQKDLERFITVIGRKRGDESSNSDSDNEDSQEESSDEEEEEEEQSSGSEEEEEEASGDEGISSPRDDDGSPVSGISAAEEVEEEEGVEETNEKSTSSGLEDEVERKMRLDDDAAAEVVARAADERRRAARRAAMAKVSRNATKSKNKGKKKGNTGPSVDSGGVWG